MVVIFLKQLFLNTFCFAPETQVRVKGLGSLAISDVRLGDILEPTNSRVISVYRFAADGQSMVDLDTIQVSTNHYVKYNGDWVLSKDHPSAYPLQSWSGGNGRPLVCLDTDTHTIPIRGFEFSDWDETTEADGAYMLTNEQKLNGHFIVEPKSYPWIFQPALHPSTKIVLEDGSLSAIENIDLGTRLSTGIVKGIGRRYVKDICTTVKGTHLSPSTLVWDNSKWKRAGHIYTVRQHSQEQVYCTLVVLGTASIELSTGEYIRDMVEIHSPDTDSPIQAVLQHSTPDAMASS